MTNHTAIIYHAGSVQQAYLLKHALNDEGIAATVVNDQLQGATGELPLGWTTAAQVLVHEDDAVRARSIAEFFDKRLAAAAHQPASQPADDELPPAEKTAPPSTMRCPACGAPRAVVCPICATLGSDFPLADAQPQTAGEENPSDAPTYICPTCNEPFQRRDARYCQECGHDFGSGVEALKPVEEPDVEPMNVRALAVLLGIVATIGALFAYFAYIL